MNPYSKIKTAFDYSIKQRIKDGCDCILPGIIGKQSEKQFNSLVNA